MKFRVFTRTWWKANKDWPNGLEPHAGRKTTLCYVESEESARDVCRIYAINHKPGRLSRKVEYYKVT